MCNGTFQHNFQPLEKETEIAINAVVDPDLQIGVCVWGGGGTCDKWGRGGASQDLSPGCPLKFA